MTEAHLLYVTLKVIGRKTRLYQGNNLQELDNVPAHVSTKYVEIILPYHTCCLSHLRYRNSETRNTSLTLVAYVKRNSKVQIEMKYSPESEKQTKDFYDSSEMMYFAEYQD